MLISLFAHSVEPIMHYLPFISTIAS